MVGFQHLGSNLVNSNSELVCLTAYKQGCSTELTISEDVGSSI
jgi:hypothetical protein